MKENCSLMFSSNFMRTNYNIDSFSRLNPIWTITCSDVLFYWPLLPVLSRFSVACISEVFAYCPMCCYYYVHVQEDYTWHTLVKLCLNIVWLIKYTRILEYVCSLCTNQIDTKSNLSHVPLIDWLHIRISTTCYLSNMQCKRKSFEVLVRSERKLK